MAGIPPIGTPFVILPQATYRGLQPPSQAVQVPAKTTQVLRCWFASVNWTDPAQRLTATVEWSPDGVSTWQLLFQFSSAGNARQATHPMQFEIILDQAAGAFVRGYLDAEPGPITGTLWGELV